MSWQDLIPVAVFLGCLFGSGYATALVLIWWLFDRRRPRP